VTRILPRYVIAKRLSSGELAFYFNVPTKFRKAGCVVANEPLGTDYVAACGDDGNGGRAAIRNSLIDEWIANRDGQPLPALSTYGSVEWLFREYKKSNAYLEKVSPRSRIDYERTMLMVCDLKTKAGDRIGDRGVRAITPAAADKIYNLLIEGSRGQRLRQGEKVVGLCARAWKVVHRLHPHNFDRAVPNPWQGVTKKRRVKKIKPAATRDQVYTFAHGCVENGYPEAAAAAVICFEWLQRPENVLSGHIRWADYRGADAPKAIRVFHHKTGETVLHPLEEEVDGETVRFYADAEDILSKLERRGLPIILRKVRDGTAKTYSLGGMAKVIHRMRDLLGLPAMFTLDACRHGGMTELEEAELTDGQGRALSAHKSRAYERYAKRTMDRALAATRKRHAHTLANTQRTAVQNDGSASVQNAFEKNKSERF
jgi:hypothetical protein